ncbi:MAG TPA: HisA/HisF-related TIM barrel protein [Methanomassiliicoccales archaeon]|nr:HisA/HisF-related TIM barrel protein [Methanomassiliicoccales archaeon]
MRPTGPVYACQHCGSRDIVPKVLFGGPIAGVDNNDNTCRCNECGRTAVPLAFRTVEDWIAFRQEAMQRSESSPIKEGFLHIPMMPVDTTPLLSLGGIDVPIAKVAEVVSVGWNGKELARTEYHVTFERYYNAVSGTRYNAKDVLLLDLSGINEAKPNFRVMRELVRKKHEIWLDLGIRSEQDLFDAFSVEVSRAFASTSTMTTMKLYQELFELSDRCVPCIQVAGHVVWGKARAGPAELAEAARRLTSIGFEELAIIDLERIGTRKGASLEFLEAAKDLGVRTLIGGGVNEADLKNIEEMGFAGALIDPFTPVIADLFGEDGSPTIVAAPEADPKPVRKPRYLATD